MIGGKKIIALCISRLHDTDNNRFIAILNEQLRSAGCSLFIYNITTDLYWNEDETRAEASVFDLIDYERTDAVVIMDEKIKSRNVSKKIVRNSRAHGIPVIVVDGNYEGCITVDFDYAGGFEKMVRHVIEHHRKKDVRLVAGTKGNPFSDEREEIFRKVAAENGVRVDEKTIFYGQFWAKPAIEAAEKMFASGDIPEAVICANDIMAINVASVFIQHGINVPEQVIVTGFDGIDEIYYSMPKISSVRTSSRLLADTVFKAVKNAVSGVDIQDRYTVEPSLVLNESCGCHDSGTMQSFVRLRNFNSRFYNYQDDNLVLNEMSDAIQSQKDLANASYVMVRDVTKDLCCLINRSCVDDTTDYLRTKRESPYDDEMFVFFDRLNRPYEQYEISRREIVPGLEKLIESGYPLIFNSIYYTNVPLGYICFHYNDYDLTDYCKIMAITNSIGRGIGGFISMRYQHYLMQRVEDIYMYDGLTGLYNRASFSNRFREKIEKTPEGTPITVVLSDLDGLKKINDNYGHFSGDDSIKAVANALKMACPPDALCVRYGGDEMIAIIIGECDAEKIVRRIRSELEKYNNGSLTDYSITSSIGVVSSKAGMLTNIEAMIKQADSLMYTEKKAKKASNRPLCREQ